MTLLRFLIYMSGICLALIACKKDNPPVMPEPVEETGPYELVTPRYFGDFQIPADNPVTKEGVSLGRMLFYEKMLSNNKTLSCASCHQQAKAFTDGEAFSKGSEGINGRRSTMSLVNLLWDKHFFWDGRTTSLEEQVLIPIQDPVEMHQSLDSAVARLQNSGAYALKFKQVFGSESITAQNIARAISQFERTLISSNSKYDRYLNKTYQPTP